jgi:uncharacterized membrane protein YphA (DoxX/SURF4 family)
VLRLALGLVMFPHGAQKLLGWFGGRGFFGTIETERSKPVGVAHFKARNQ